MICPIHNILLQFQVNRLKMITDRRFDCLFFWRKCMSNQTPETPFPRYGYPHNVTITIFLDITVHLAHLINIILTLQG